MLALPEFVRDWVRQRVASGHYASEGDHVADLIQHDQALAAEQDALIAALDEGERSGISERRLTDMVAASRKEAAGPSNG